MPPITHEEVTGRVVQDRGAPYVMGISGASGALLARHAIAVLGALGTPVYLTYTEACHQVWLEEVGRSFTADLEDWLAHYPVRAFKPNDFRAPIASGSFLTAGMLVMPCSMRTLSAIAHGSSANLLERAADVTLKEGRRLVLVPRETPLSAIHLENMLKLARLGVHIVPPIPPFYMRPRSTDEIIDLIVRRAIAVLGITEALPPQQRWRSQEEP